MKIIIQFFENLKNWINIKMQECVVGGDKWIFAHKYVLCVYKNTFLLESLSLDNIS